MVVGAAVDMLRALIDVYPDEELESEFGTSPQFSLIAPPMDVDDQVVGVVPGSQRRKGYLTNLQMGGLKLAEVYRLLREQTEGAGEIRLPSHDTVAEGEVGQVRRRDTLEVWGGGANLDVGTWNYEDMCVLFDLLCHNMDYGLILGGFGLAVANRTSSTNACPRRSSTTPRIRSTSTMTSVLRLLHLTRRATLRLVNSQTRPRRPCKDSLSTIRRTLHPRITLILGMRLDRVIARILHGTEI